MISFKTFILERVDVGDLALESRKLIDDYLFAHVKGTSAFFFDTATGGSSDYDYSDVLQQISDSWHERITNYSESFFRQFWIGFMETTFQRLANEHAEKMFTKVPTIVVSIKNDDSTNFPHAHGHFDLNPEVYRPRKEDGDYIIQIVVFCNLKEFNKKLIYDITEQMFDCSEYNSFKKYHSYDVRTQVEEIIDIFIHEVGHLFQHLEQAKKTPLKNDEIKYRELHRKTFVSKANIVKIIDNNSREWTPEMWNVYTSRSIEIDAHASGVATQIIQSMIPMYNPSTTFKLEFVNNAIQELTYLYNNATSFKTYKDVRDWNSDTNRKTDFEKVFKRFLKKVYQYIDVYRDKLKAKIKEEQAEEAKWKKENQW
jgi:hypothetical protein